MQCSYWREQVGSERLRGVADALLCDLRAKPTLFWAFIPHLEGSLTLQFKQVNEYLPRAQTPFGRLSLFFLC